MENCMFQYGTRHRVLANTDLITKEEAIDLFEKNVADYKERFENDEDPEMCIWVDCKSNSDYKETIKHWSAHCIVLIDGLLYEQVG